MGKIPAPCRDANKRGYSLSEENTPFRSPRERRGETPSTPALAVGRLKSCAACGIGCLPSVAARRFDFLLLPAAALPACRQPSAISAYFGCYQTCRCLPGRHCFARRVCWHYRQKVITPHLRSDSRAAADARSRGKSYRYKKQQAPDSAGCAALQAPDCQCGGRGGRPSSFSGGFKGGILFGKRIPPLATRHLPQINYPL